MLWTIRWMVHNQRQASYGTPVAEGQPMVKGEPAAMKDSPPSYGPAPASGAR